MNYSLIINDILATLSEHINDYPKKIFMSEKLFKYMQVYSFAMIRYNKKNIQTIFGIPIETFESDKYEWWFSWNCHEYIEGDEENEL